MRPKIALLFLVSIAYFQATAQQALSLKQAIQIGVAENTAVKIAMNNALMAAEQNNAAFAGELPQLLLQGGYNYSNNNTHLKYSTGSELTRSGAVTNAINGGPVLTQTLFDGGKMFATRHRLDFTASSVFAIKDYIAQQLAEQIVTAHYDISREINLLRQLKSNDYYYTERYNTAKIRRDVGKATDQDVLQAEIDRNSNTAAVYRQQASLANAYITLNRLLNRNPAYPFSITDTLMINIPFTFDTLTTSIIKRNPQLLSNQFDVNSATEAIKEQKSGLYPRLNASASYNYSYTKNQVGLVLLNQTSGPGIGLGLTYNLFNGSITHHQINIAKLQLQNATETFNSNVVMVQADAMQAYNQYQALLKVATLLDDNTNKAKQNVNLALDRFKIGNITQVDLIQAQSSYETASEAYIQSLYDLAVAGNHLLRVTGMLKW